MGNGTSVAWGDVNGDGFKTEGSDLMVGGNPLPPGTTFYYNTNGRVSTGLPEEPIKFFFPANGIALHDVNSDGDLDIVAATGQAERIYQFDQPGDAYSQISNWRSTTADDSRSLVMSDFNQDNDGVLELMVANVDTPSTYYLNPGLQLETSSPSWYTPGSAKSYSIAWGYLDNDIFPDVAIGNYGQANQVYHNNGDNTFSLVEWSPNITTDQTRSVAWGDYDADGDMDLAVGNEGEPNYIYENQNGTLSATYVWSFTLAHNTTSLAWGDWDNDRDLDLAVGNTSGSQVYVNQGSTPGSPRFLWLWRSNEANNVQGVAWGDVDGDGDLDLAVAGTDISGYYDNNYVAPAHLGLNYRSLPLNSAYLSIERPVPAEGQIWYRKLLTDPTSLQIPVNFTIYDPDGTHQNGVRSNASIANGNVISIAFEYSLNGGGSWQPANGNWNSSNPTDVFTWIAGQDLNGVEEAVSDIIRLRISIIHKNKTGQLQRAKTSAISPPIRVRNLSCAWPEETSFSYQPTTVTAGEAVQFLATTIGGGDEEFGQIIFVWDFGDTMTTTGHLAQHTYTTAGTYTVTLTANGAACPIARSESVTQTIVVGVHILENPVYLPVILKSSSGGSTAGVSGGIGILNITADSPARVTGLVGHVSSGATTLRWEAAAPEDGAAGYRLYGSPAGTIAFQLLAELPADVTTYTDAATCGQMYFVTAYNASGESLPSTASYFSPPCQ
jgi:PKD repeat protein